MSRIPFDPEEWIKLPGGDPESPGWAPRRAIVWVRVGAKYNAKLRYYAPHGSRITFVNGDCRYSDLSVPEMVAYLNLPAEEMPTFESTVASLTREAAYERERTETMAAAVTELERQLLDARRELAVLRATGASHGLTVVSGSGVGGELSAPGESKTGWLSRMF